MALLKLITMENALEELNRRFSQLRPGTERLSSSEAYGRFLAGPIRSKDPVPHFARSIMDGYAVRAAETEGSSETSPALFTSAGEVIMGEAPSFSLRPGETAYIPTGGMLPEGADAVVMVEYSEVRGDEIALMKPASPGMNVVPAGGDIPRNAPLFESGRRLDAPDIGVLAASGIEEVDVYRKPAMTLLSTGDEILGPEEELTPGKIRDINTYTIKIEAERMGYDVVRTAAITDDRTALEDAVRKAMTDSDVLFLSGGSSVGKKDYTPEVFNKMGNPGCFVHGIAFKPGKPTVLAEADGFPLIGLPGHPISSLTIFRILGKALLYRFNGATVPPVPWIDAVLSRNVHPAPGRDTYMPVILRKKGGERGFSIDHEPVYEAVPLSGGSSMITMLSRADGYILVSRETDGIREGEKVRVFQF